MYKVKIDNKEHEITIDSFKELSKIVGKIDFIVNIQVDTFWELFKEIREIRDSYNGINQNIKDNSVAYCFGFFIHTYV